MSDIWRLITRKEKEDGAQIDLLIDSSDDAITACEIKYTEQPFSVDKQYYNTLNKKLNIFKKINTNK
jgi:hypothetical protein